MCAAVEIMMKSMSRCTIIMMILYSLMCSTTKPSSIVAMALSSKSVPSNKKQQHRFVILGGTGQIGTAVATHLLYRRPKSEIVLVGRRSGGDSSAEKSERAIEIILSSLRKQYSSFSSTKKEDAVAKQKISFVAVNDVWSYDDIMVELFRDSDCVIHTAGPYSDRDPVPLELAIRAKCKAYIDVSDPLLFLDKSLQLSDAAAQAGTSALLAAGAFPGMSNVLAVEAAAAAAKENNHNNNIQDIRFHYFTKGLGGSGTVNLFITNKGFGDPITQYDNGKLRSFDTLSGQLLGKVDFFLSPSDLSNGQQSSSVVAGNKAAKDLVGTRTIFAWPFPEAATVGKEFDVRGSTGVAMGTDPELWNTMLGFLVAIVPRKWWQSNKFSQFMADFSEPLVKFTDYLLQKTSPDGVGETHAMRIDVVGGGGGNDEEGRQKSSSSVSIVQGHESFRRCVGQSCAEFAIDVLEHPANGNVGGVFLPEQRYRDAKARDRIIKKLTDTPGTFCYTGAVQLREKAPLPTDLLAVLEKETQQI